MLFVAFTKYENSGHSYKPGSVFDNHLSRLAITDKLQRPTLPGGDGQPPGIPIWSCSGWGLHGQHVSMLPVSSYLTISTLPQPNCFGGMFLLHFPYSYLRQTLSGTLALRSPDFPHARQARTRLSAVPRIFNLINLFNLLHLISTTADMKKSEWSM